MIPIQSLLTTKGTGKDSGDVRPVVKHKDPLSQAFDVWFSDAMAAFSSVPQASQAIAPLPLQAQTAHTGAAQNVVGFKTNEGGTAQHPSMGAQRLPEKTKALDKPMPHAGPHVAFGQNADDRILKEPKQVFKTDPKVMQQGFAQAQSSLSSEKRSQPRQSAVQPAQILAPWLQNVRGQVVHSLQAHVATQDIAGKSELTNVSERLAHFPNVAQVASTVGQAAMPGGLANGPKSTVHQSSAQGVVGLQWTPTQHVLQTFKSHGQMLDAKTQHTYGATPTATWSLQQQGAQQAFGRLVSQQVGLGKTELRVQVHPEGMGQIQIAVTHDATGVMVHVKAEQSQTAVWFQQQLQAITDAIRSAGVQTSSVQVSWEQGSSASDFSGRQQSDGRQPFRQRRSDTASSAAPVGVVGNPEFADV